MRVVSPWFVVVRMAVAVSLVRGGVVVVVMVVAMAMTVLVVVLMQCAVPPMA